jgi:hypothetical protein
VWTLFLSVGYKRIAAAEARGQFENLEEGEYPPLEAVTKGLLKTYQTEKT